MLDGKGCLVESASFVIRDLRNSPSEIDSRMRQFSQSRPADRRRRTPPCVQTRSIFPRELREPTKVTIASRKGPKMDVAKNLHTTLETSTARSIATAQIRYWNPRRRVPMLLPHWRIPSLLCSHFWSVWDFLKPLAADMIQRSKSQDRSTCATRKGIKCAGVDGTLMALITHRTPAPPPNGLLCTIFPNEITPSSNIPPRGDPSKHFLMPC